MDELHTATAQAPDGQAVAHEPNVADRESAELLLPDLRRDVPTDRQLVALVGLRRPVRPDHGLQPVLQVALDAPVLHGHADTDVQVSLESGELLSSLGAGPTVDDDPLPAAGVGGRVGRTRNRTDDGLAVLLAAEQEAPEQVRFHLLSRQLVISWMRRRKTSPPPQLRQLAERIRVA